jgi:hypothetical protein
MFVAVISYIYKDLAQNAESAAPPQGIFPPTTQPEPGP